jgi:hypothetical protein
MLLGGQNFMKKLLLILALVHAYPMIGIIDADIANLLGVRPNARPHEILGVPATAPVNVINKAHRTLAAKWHPDKNTNDRAGAVTAAINGAKDRLVNPTHQTTFFSNGNDDDDDDDEILRNFFEPLHRQWQGEKQRRQTELDRIKIVYSIFHKTIIVLIAWPFVAVGIREAAGRIKMKVANYRKRKLVSAPDSKPKESNEN